MASAAATGAQEVWSLVPATVQKRLEVPANLMLFSGMALGYADTTQPINPLRTERAALEDFVRMKGFDALQASAAVGEPDPSSERACQHARATESIEMNLSWIGCKRSLELSPRARLVDDIDAELLLRKREALAWRPLNGFLKDEQNERLLIDKQAYSAA